MIDTAKHQITSENIGKIREWIRTRGGIAIWGSVNFNDLGKTWTTPVNGPDGQPVGKPHWGATDQPIRIITSEDDVEVCIDKEVKRFHVAIRRGAQGFMMKLTDASSDKVKRAVSKAGVGAYHVFDYETQEAVIMAPDKVIPLSNFP